MLYILKAQSHFPGGKKSFIYTQTSESEPIFAKRGNPFKKARHDMNFFCVYVKTRKKIDKYIKINKVKNKYIIDIKKIMEEEELTHSEDKTYLKIIVFNKIQQAIDKDKDIYYIPDFDNDFSIEKLLNLKKILGDNPFNVLVFYNEFRKCPELIDDVFGNLSKFSNSQIIRDY